VLAVGRRLARWFGNLLPRPANSPAAPVVFSQDLESNGQGLALQRSTDTIRETTKWLTGAFAAIGAVLVAGLQIAKLGQLELSGVRIVVALLGLTVALAGVARVILKASDVLTVRYASFKEISQEQWREELKERGIATEGAPMLSSELLDWIEASIEQAWPSLTRDLSNKPEDRSARQLLDDLSETQQQTYRGLLSLEEELRKHTDAKRPPNPDGSEADVTLRFQLLRERTRRLDRSVDLILAFANDCIARRQFVRFRQTCLWAGSAVALGAVLLAGALNPPSAPAATAQGPRPVTVYLWDNELRARLGPTCGQTPIRAVAIGGSLKEPLVVIDPSSGCTARRLTITHERGVALPSMTTPTTTLPKPSLP
jgi:hypothetical protein